MAYCPRCGVEVDDQVRECPLCHFPIPNIRLYEEVDTYMENSKMEDNDEEALQIMVRQYPEARNIYNDYVRQWKRRVFSVILGMVLSTILILGVIALIYPMSRDVTAYIFIGVSSFLGYAFFAMGYLGSYWNISGFFLVTLYLTYMLNWMMEKDWFMSYAFPVCFLVYLMLLGLNHFVRKSEKKAGMRFIPAILALHVSLLCFGVDAVVSWNMGKRINLTWSYVVAASAFAVALVLEIVIHVFLGKRKADFQRKWHL